MNQKIYPGPIRRASEYGKIYERVKQAARACDAGMEKVAGVAGSPNGSHVIVLKRGAV